MRTTMTGWFFCLLTAYAYGQDVCMYYEGEKVCYKVSATRILIKSETLTIHDIENILQNPVVGRLKNSYDLGSGIFFIEMEHTSKEDMWKLQRQFSSREDVIYTSPVYGSAPGSGYTNEIFVRIKSKDDYSVLQKYATVYHIKDIKPREFGELNYKLTLPHNPEKDAMQTALELYETGFFVYAEPNGILLCPFEYCPFEYEPDGNMNIIPEERTIVCYPNPVRDILYVDLGKYVHSQTSYDIRLYNSQGKMVHQTKVTGGTVEFWVSNLSDGIYFLNICNGSASKPETHKIIVTH